MRRPSAKIISPFSTRVFKIQVTFVGALSASSTTRMWPNFTALTFEDRKCIIRNKRAKVTIIESSWLTALIGHSRLQVPGTVGTTQSAADASRGTQTQQQVWHFSPVRTVPNNDSHPRMGETESAIEGGRSLVEQSPYSLECSLIRGDGCSGQRKIDGHPHSGKSEHIVSRTVNVRKGTAR